MPKENSIPSDIIKPSYESYMATIRIELHLANFKSHPTRIVGHCLKCDDDISNSLHIFLDCPLATFMWDIGRNTTKYY